MAQVTMPTDLQLSGSLVAQQIFCSEPSISDSMILANAGIQSSKMEHRFTAVYSQPGGQVASVERKVVHVVCGLTATILVFQVGARVAAIGGAVATFDLQVNGVSILTAVVNLASGSAAYALAPGLVQNPSLAKGNVVEVVIPSVSAGGGTLAQGLFAYVQLREDPS